MFFKRTRKYCSSILRRFGWWIPDRIYLHMMYFVQMGKVLHLKSPETYSEKLQWLKLYNRKPEYTMMVDKYAVKDYVAKLIGKEHVIPTLGVWNRPEDIEWDILPNQFVLKITNGGGSKGVVICKEKESFDKNLAVTTLNKALRRNIYKMYREWPYKDIKPRIIAEKYMEDVDNPTEELHDYKVYCFNGEPLIIMYSTGRFNGGITFDYYDTKWNKLPLEWDKPNSKFIAPRPQKMEELLSISETLAKGIPHVRVDLYIINNSVYFGELTFFDSSGFSHFTPSDWNLKLGKKICLPI